MKQLRKNKTPFFKNKKGFVLIEILIGMGIISWMTVLAMSYQENERKVKIAKNVGEHIKQVGEAANEYLVTFYQEIMEQKDRTNVNGDVGDRTCSNNICTITTKTLSETGFLPIVFSGKNPVGLDYEIKIVREGTAPNYVLNGIVVTKKPWINALKKPNYGLLGEAIQQTGVNAGFVSDSGSALALKGYRGSWEIPKSSYGGNVINQNGQLGYRFGFQTGSVNAFLRRDGVLPMTGDLNMDGFNIININELHGVNGNSIKIKDHLLAENGIESNEDIISNKDICAHNLGGAKICMGTQSASNEYRIEMYNDLPLRITGTGGMVDNDNHTFLIVNGNTVINRDLTVKNDQVVQKNLHVGRSTKNRDISNYSSGSDRGRNIKSYFGSSTLGGYDEGIISSNLSVSKGVIVERKNSSGTDYNSLKPNSRVAVDLNENGVVYADDMFIRTGGDGGISLKYALPSYTSRGAFVVEDGDIIEKPHCRLGVKYDGTEIKGSAKIILTAGNLLVYGNEKIVAGDANSAYARSFSEMTNPSNVHEGISDVDQLETLGYHGIPEASRILLKAVEVNNGKAWRAVVQTRDYLNKPIKAGQALAHIYCQIY